MSNKIRLFDKFPGIIPSLDVNLADMKRILEDVSCFRDEISGLKIGSLLVWTYGLERVVNEIKAICDIPIIFDAQKAGTDIPSIVEDQVKLVAESGVDAFITSPLGSGPETLDSFIRSSFKHDITPIVLLEMTHPKANAFLRENVGEEILIHSLEMNVENFVAPGNNPERIKKYRSVALEMNKEIKIHSPGIGPQGGGPDAAVEAGTDFVIIGRTIYQAENPKKEITHIYKLIEHAYNDRNK